MAAESEVGIRDAPFIFLYYIPQFETFRNDCRLLNAASEEVRGLGALLVEDLLTAFSSKFFDR